MTLLGNIAHDAGKYFWRPSRLNELTSIIFNMVLIHLSSETSIYTIIVNHLNEFAEILLFLFGLADKNEVPEYQIYTFLLIFLKILCLKKNINVEILF